MSLKLDRYYQGAYGGPGGCHICKHVTKEGSQGSEKGWTCKAFPQGIPRGIYVGRERHDFQQPYDQGISFEVDPVQVQDDDGKPCWSYWDWFGSTFVVETVAELPVYAKPEKPPPKRKR